MGEVYRGHDLRLKRDVAIKVLPEAFTSDAERLARFQREAELLATLNHPNIAQIYGLEDHALIVAAVNDLRAVWRLHRPLVVVGTLRHAAQRAPGKVVDLDVGGAVQGLRECEPAPVG